ncbi:MAG: hypothetical protein JO257_21045 [Deltaproteobacteria bacterium]|nr:hypothetical protein [Deltaproteobacteria bacterium]
MDDGSDAGSDAVTQSTEQGLTASCPAYNSSVYTPYVGGSSPTGTVAQYPWRGPTSTYPSGDEAFNGYGTALPKEVECGSDKSLRPYLDVTAGCLDAITTTSGNRGKISLTSDGSYRSFAKAYTSGGTSPVKWTDSGTSYNFYYSKSPLSVGVNPGFKAFLRYRTEYDLYVASWRADGVVQIQKKQCGVYTPLKVIPNYGKPSPGTWHTIKFEAVGDKLSLWLDGKFAMSVTDSTFTWGTAGIRIDSYDGSYIDNWKVYAP